MICPHCSRETAEAPHCTFCGADLSGSEVRHRRRAHRYAAHPHEHVRVPAVFSTLLPHLGLHQLHEFRLAGLVGLSLLLVVTALGYVGAALAGAAVLVPFLFLLYLREAEVYRREPVPVLLRSAGAGALAGLVVTGAANWLVAPPAGSPADAGQVAVLAVAVPLVLSLLAPAALLGLRRHFAFTVDGLTFGVAAGLGWALAETALNFSATIADSATRVDARLWVLTVVSAGALVPVAHGCAAGAVAAGWWRLRGGARRGVALLVLATGPLGAVCFALGSELLAQLDAAAWTITLWQLLVTALLLLVLRAVLHDALLDEAHAAGLREQHCPHCDAGVEAAGFCPRCGLALAAAPRSTAA